MMIAPMPRALPNALAYDSAETLTFGHAPHPVTCGYDVTIGGGEVLPEIKFTLPTILIEEATIPRIRDIYREIVTQVLEKSIRLNQPALVLEFEQLYEMTRDPALGAMITADIREVMDTFHTRYGIRTALRVTVADIREQQRPPRMQDGPLLAQMLEAFELCAAAGADLLAIESTGGKEVSDRALLGADLGGIAYALGVLAPVDMGSLWDQISSIAARHGVVPAGDTACGFGNTAMQLAHQGMIPKVLAAIVRLMTIPRSLTAVLRGAVGPLKDCGYENPAIKALTGVPIAMEGKASACAHSSPLGNIASATCDLWSNESVQQVRLLGGYAPEVFAEILIYDCRLMNQALATGTARTLRELFVRSDRTLDPQALVLDPAVMFEAATRLLESGTDTLAQVITMGHLAVEVIERAVAHGELKLSPRESRWLSKLQRTLDTLPDDPEALREGVDPRYSEFYLPQAYGL